MNAIIYIQSSSQDLGSKGTLFLGTIYGASYLGDIVGKETFNPYWMKQDNKSELMCFNTELIFTYKWSKNQNKISNQFFKMTRELYVMFAHCVILILNNKDNFWV